MLRPILLGLVAGMRSITPLAVVSDAARRGRLPRGNGAPTLLADPRVCAGVTALAVGELLGDKLPSAPDRIVPAGLLARLITAAVSGAALAPRRRRVEAAALAAGAATGFAFLSWHVRMAALRRWGQTPTGLVEDALSVSAALLIVYALND